jgi:hypothetical protein
MTSRRGFLKGLAGALFVASVNLEQFKFVAPKKVLKAKSAVELLNEELEKVYSSKKLDMLFERDCVFYSSIQREPIQVVSSREMHVPLQLESCLGPEPTLLSDKPQVIDIDAQPIESDNHILPFRASNRLRSPNE